MLWEFVSVRLNFWVVHWSQPEWHRWMWGGGQGWLIENWEHFANTITWNVRSVTWQKQGNAWYKQLIVLYSGVLDQHTLLEPDLLPFPASSSPWWLELQRWPFGWECPQGSQLALTRTFPLFDVPLSYYSSSVAPVIFLLMHSSDLLKENLFNSGWIWAFMLKAPASLYL